MTHPGTQRSATIYGCGLPLGWKRSPGGRLRPPRPTVAAGKGGKGGGGLQTRAGGSGVPCLPRSPGELPPGPQLGLVCRMNRPRCVVSAGSRRCREERMTPLPAPGTGDLRAPPAEPGTRDVPGSQKGRALCPQGQEVQGTDLGGGRPRRGPRGTEGAQAVGPGSHGRPALGLRAPGPSQDFTSPWGAGRTGRPARDRGSGWDSALDTSQ